MKVTRISNEAAEVLFNSENVMELAHSWEDNNLDAISRAELAYEFIERHTPGHYVLVVTGTYIKATCDHAACDRYDPSYFYLLVPRKIWINVRHEVYSKNRKIESRDRKCKGVYAHQSFEEHQRDKIYHSFLY